MRALSVRQPWAWAIACAGKTVENRTWPTRYTGEVAIHASKACDEVAVMPTPEALGLFMDAVLDDMRGGVPALAAGVVIAVAQLAGCHPHPDADSGCYRDSGDSRWPACSPWAVPGQWHWQLVSVRPLPEPVPCRGALGLWRLPDDVGQAVRKQLGDTRASPFRDL
jgi:hypothetical protein